MKKLSSLLIPLFLCGSSQAAVIDVHNHYIGDEYIAYLEANNLSLKEGFPLPEWSLKTDTDFIAFGSDTDPHCAELTMINAKRAGVDKFLRVSSADIKNFNPTSERGTLITNPPYGEGMLDIKEAERLYSVMGNKFVSKKGWSYGIISPDEQFEKCFGRKADKRRKLYNGMIKCQYYMYFR